MLSHDARQTHAREGGEGRESDAQSLSLTLARGKLHRAHPTPLTDHCPVPTVRSQPHPSLHLSTLTTLTTHRRIAAPHWNTLQCAAFVLCSDVGAFVIVVVVAV